MKHVVRNVETLRPGRVTPELRHRVLELVKVKSQGATARQLVLAQSTVAKIVKAAREAKTC